MGRFTGMRPHWKKAIVTLAKGNKIDFFEGV
jgi:ribosomal protein L23